MENMSFDDLGLLLEVIEIQMVSPYPWSWTSIPRIAV
jgi:hypothetical protein